MSELAAAAPRGSVAGGMFVMLLLALLLLWLPGIGALIAGIVGGKIAGGAGRGLLAAVLPCLLLGVALFFLATLLTGLPVIGVIAGMGGFVLALCMAGPLLLGAVIGGLLA